MSATSVTYARSNVLGYASNLPTYNIRLPLKYSNTSSSPSTSSPPPPSSSSSSTSTTTTTNSSSSALSNINSTITDPNDQFHQRLATAGRFLKFEKVSLFNTISCSILNDLKTIVLTPIELKANSLGLKFQNLQLQLPNVVSSPNCVTFHNNQDYIWIDIIDSNYLLISLQIPIETFIENRKNLVLLNFDKWGKISVPYSFEMRSQPFSIKASDELNLFISLKDGGFLHFSRQTPISDVSVFVFNEPVSIIGGLFGGGKRNIEINGISSNAIVDFILFGDGKVLTLSVSKELKIWNVSTHLLVKTTTLYNKSEHDMWLTRVPTKYLQVLDVDNFDAADTNNRKKLVTSFITTKNGESNKSRFAFKLWFYSENQLLEEVTKFEFQPELPNTLLSNSDIFFHDSTFQNKIWFIQDYEVEFVEAKKYIKYHILWKSNTSSILAIYTLDFSNGSIVLIDVSQPSSHTEEEAILQSRDLDFYATKIFASGDFDDLIVATSLTILAQHLKSTEVINPLELRHFAETLIQTHSSKQRESPKHLWFKLYSLCEEFSKTSQEAFAIAPFGVTTAVNATTATSASTKTASAATASTATAGSGGSGGFGDTIGSTSSLICLQASGCTFLRPSSYYESISYKNLDSADGKLMQIFDKFRKTLSTKTYEKLHRQLVTSFNEFDGAASANEVFQTYLQGKIDESEIQQILLKLGEIPDVLQIIQSLLFDNDFLLVASSSSISSLGSFAKLSVFKTFQNIMQQHQDLLMDLIILLLVCEANDEIIKLLNSAVQSIRHYDTAELIFKTSFSSSSIEAPVELSTVANVQNSIFWLVFVLKDKTLAKLIDSMQINAAFDYFFHEVLSPNQAYLAVAIQELIVHNQGQYLRKDFLPKLDHNERFFTGIIRLITNDPQGFFNAFENYDEVMKFDFKSLLLLKKNSNFKSFLEEFDDYPSKSEYFHALSLLCLAQIKTSSTHLAKDDHLFIEVALKLEQLAIDNGTNDTIIESYYFNVFEQALTIADFKLVEKSLSKLSKTPELQSLLKKFIYKLIQDLKIKLIFKWKEDNGDKDKDFYIQHYSMIDSIIHNFASQQPLFQSLKIYEYLYSWRLLGCVTEGSDRSKTLAQPPTSHQPQLGDQRGAVEALYEFITRFKDETTTIEKRVKLKILELYMIVLNLMKTFAKDDQWLVRQLKDGREIVKMEHIEIECFEWMKNLDDDLSILS